MIDFGLKTKMAVVHLLPASLWHPHPVGRAVIFNGQEDTNYLFYVLAKKKKGIYLYIYRKLAQLVDFNLDLEMLIVL